MNAELIRVEFSLREEAEVVLLALDAGGGGSSAVFALKRSGGNLWRSTLCLKPGNYAARYYVGDAARIVYHGPAMRRCGAGQLTIDAMDAHFVVAPEAAHEGDGAGYTSEDRCFAPEAARAAGPAASRWGNPYSC